MSLIIQPKRWPQKPPLGVQINWGHPLANGLVACILMGEGGGTVVRDVLTNLPLTGSALTWGATPNGLCGINTSSANSTYPQSSSFGRLTSGVPLTLGFVGAANAGNNGSYRGEIAVTLGSNQTYGAGWSGTTGVPNASCRNGASQQVVSGSAVGLNIDTLVVATFTSITSRALFVNGVQAATGSTSIADFTPTKISVLGDPQNNGGLIGTLAIAWVWNRVLDAAEIALLQNDRFAMFQPQSPQRRFWVVPDASGGPFPFYTRRNMSGGAIPMSGGVT